MATMFSKCDEYRIRSWNFEIMAAQEEFREMLRKHFEIVDSKATNMILGRWIDEENKESTKQ